MEAKPNISRLCHHHPNIDDILDDSAPFPYTLAAFIAFLDETHSLENAEFLLESKRYFDSYEWLKSSRQPGETPGLTAHLWGIWNRLVDRYMRLGAPREINIPDAIRQGIVKYQESHQDHPAPSILDPAVRYVEDLLQECVLMPFIMVCSANSRLHSHSTPNLREAGLTPTSGAASEYPRVRKRSKLGKYLSHHAGLQDLGHPVEGEDAETEPASPRVDEEQARISWEESLSQEMARTTLGHGIVRPKTAPTRQPRWRWAIFNRMFDKHFAQSPD